MKLPTTSCLRAFSSGVFKGYLGTYRKLRVRGSIDYPLAAWLWHSVLQMGARQTPGLPLRL